MPYAPKIIPKFVGFEIFNERLFMLQEILIGFEPTGHYCILYINPVKIGKGTFYILFLFPWKGEKSEVCFRGSEIIKELP